MVKKKRKQGVCFELPWAFLSGETGYGSHITSAVLRSWQCWPAVQCLVLGASQSVRCCICQVRVNVVTILMK